MLHLGQQGEARGRTQGASSKKEMLFNLHCVGGKTRGPWSLASPCLQVVCLCLFFWPFFFFLFLWANCSH